MESNKVKRFIDTVVVIGFIAMILMIEKTESKASEPVVQYSEEQRYIIRYGTTYDWGSTIVTEDGNEWGLIDAPEYDDGTAVIVFFDSNKTKDVTDDIIIDVMERR